MLIPKVYATAFVVDNSRKSYIHNICTSQHMLYVGLHIVRSSDVSDDRNVCTAQQGEKNAEWRSFGVAKYVRTGWLITISRHVPTSAVAHFWSFLLFFFISLGEKMRSKQSNFFYDIIYYFASITCLFINTNVLMFFF